MTARHGGHGRCALDTTPAHLAGHRVIATELLVWGEDPSGSVGGDWWSLPLARDGSLATALAPDTLTAHRNPRDRCRR
ncbi:hypothetical protein Q5530_12505 [Saccharothrix sp. BKS2]|uniref:hypothetical protein n=1 Tax=Saccharothrix sp. BKS2 TaxID=3064400 RepID=UPI0039E93324